MNPLLLLVPILLPIAGGFALLRIHPDDDARRNFCAELLAIVNTLAVFALLSEIPFNLFMDKRIISTGHQSVMLTLFLAFSGMIMFKYAKGNLRFLSLTGLVLPLLADYLHTDYGALGVITVYLFYLLSLRHPGGMNRISSVEILSALLPLFAIAFLSWDKEYACVLSVPILLLYNGERGRGCKYFFYLFYPLHFLVLVFIYYVITGR